MLRRRTRSKAASLDILHKLQIIAHGEGSCRSLQLDGEPYGPSMLLHCAEEESTTAATLVKWPLPAASLTGTKAGMGMGMFAAKPHSGLFSINVSVLVLSMDDTATTSGDNATCNVVATATFAMPIAEAQGVRSVLLQLEPTSQRRVLSLYPFGHNTNAVVLCAVPLTAFALNDETAELSNFLWSMWLHYAVDTLALVAGTHAFDLVVWPHSQ